MTYKDYSDRKIEKDYMFCSRIGEHICKIASMDMAWETLSECIRNDVPQFTRFISEDAFYLRKTLEHFILELEGGRWRL